ncbi:MAG: hypothetical protein M1600_12445 [Firmicutes bacterium]|jgi:hypothetical protein|nr:hypothetical protein [Bacillota bacterium]
MTRNVDALILTAVNTCWREPITLPTLLDLLREQQPPDEWIGPVRQLFADVSVNAIRRFAEHHQLSPSLMGRYYTQFIRPLGDINPELEAWVNGRLGTTL